MSTTLSSPSCCTKWASRCLAGWGRSYSKAGNLRRGVGTHWSDSDTPPSALKGTCPLVHPCQPPATAGQVFFSGFEDLQNWASRGHDGAVKKDGLGCASGSVPFWRTVMCPGHSLEVHLPQILSRTTGRLPKDILLLWCVEVPERRSVTQNKWTCNMGEEAHISFDRAVGHTQVQNR